MNRDGDGARASHGVAGFAIVFAICAVLSLAGWLPLGVPGRLLRWVLSLGSYGVLGVSAGFAGGLFAMLPAVVISVTLYVFRAALTRWLRAALATRLTPNARYLLAPAIATLAFTSCWGYVHAATPYRSGLVPHIVFPAIVGVCTFAMAEHGAAIARLGPAVLDVRERLPLWVRIAAVVVLSSIVSLALMHGTPVHHIDLKQQAIVLVSLALGFVALAPRPRTTAATEPAR